MIVACHTIPNIRLLLLSESAAHPNGLANGSGLLGRHFMSHPAVSVFGLFDEPTQPHRGVSGALLRAAGASEVWAGPTAAIHQAGGTPMGTDPASSVTNAWGRTHEVENLFVAGASLFPTIAAVNPTATLSALALRTADHIRENRAALLA